MRSACRALLALAVLAIWAVLAPTVQAHARVIASFPLDGAVLDTTPPSIHIWFSEPVQPVSPGLLVVSPSGTRLTLGPLHADGIELWANLHTTAPGTYLVIWQVISLDTHPGNGRFTFSIGHAGPVPGSPGFSPNSALGLTLQVLARWLHLAGFALGFGPIAFRLLVLRPLGLRGESAQRRLQRLSTGGMVLLVLAAPLAVLGQTASLGGLWDATLVGDALSSSFGRVLAQQLSAAAGLWLLIGVVKAGVARAEWLLLLLGALLALADGQASHAVSSGPLLVGLLANAGHLAAMGLWVGGLFSLLAVWNLPDVAPCRGQVFRALADLLRPTLVLLGFTGILMALIHLGSPTGLLDSTYGRILLAKTILLLAILPLAWHAGRTNRARRTMLWRAELLALVVMLALAALLVSLSPPA